MLKKSYNKHFLYDKVVTKSGLLWMVKTLHHFSKGSFPQSPYNLIYEQDKEAVISKALGQEDTTSKITDFTVLTGTWQVHSS